MISSYKKLSFSDIFGWQDNDIYEYLPKSNNMFLSSSGRGGLEACIDLLGINENESVLMPVLTAEGAVNPFYRKGVKVIFFDIKPNLEIDVDKIIKIIKVDSSIRCLFAIHYLGYPQNINELKNICKKRGIFLIEDCAQALFSKSIDGLPLGVHGDISLFSLAKTIPVIDGAIFFINSKKLNTVHIRYRYSIPGVLARVSILLTLLLNNFISQLKTSEIFWKLNSINKYIYSFYYKMLLKAKKPMKMSLISKRIIKNINYENIIINTKKNLRIFYKNIDKNRVNLLFKDLDPNVMLMGVPIILNNRDDIYHKLRKKRIFCTIFDKHWNYIEKGKEDFFPNAKNVLDNVLIIPITYKANSDEILKMIKELNKLTI